jgi:hypothetical protein
MFLEIDEAGDNPNISGFESFDSIFMRTFWYSSKLLEFGMAMLSDFGVHLPVIIFESKYSLTRAIIFCWKKEKLLMNFFEFFEVLKVFFSFFVV